MKIEIFGSMLLRARMLQRWVVPLALIGCRPAERPTATGVPLYDNLGRFHVGITTTSDKAQRFFDQGMRLAYAFNHAEAVASFEAAARLDPRCAMCQWAIAYALGPNINAPMDSAAGAGAAAAIGQARTLAAGASDRERDFIEAMATRYSADPMAPRPPLDSAFAVAMAGLAAKYPGDLEAATIHADALMNLRPWDYWAGIGRPYPGTAVLVAELERVMAADSTHPGACHLFIHAIEATEPARAVGCAERLAALMPGAGHLVHMPSHIYVRIGRYQEAIDHNHHAAHADSALSAADRISPTYAALYVSHNYHFLGFAALLSGQAELGIRAAQRTAATMPPAEAIQLPEYQPLVAFEHLMLQKFGRWDQVLALPLPDSSLPVGRAVAEYARGTALAATGRFEEAEALLPVIGRRAEGSYSPIAKGIVELAAHSLAGELAGRRGQWAAAERAFRSAMAIEDGFTYMEPPWWIEPVRHPLGALLLRAGKAAAAEVVFREDLVRFPANVWSLVGLRESLAAQGKPSAEIAAQAAAAVTQAGHDPKVAHY